MRTPNTDLSMDKPHPWFLASILWKKCGLYMDVYGTLWSWFKTLYICKWIWASRFIWAWLLLFYVHANNHFLPHFGASKVRLTFKYSNISLIYLPLLSFHRTVVLWYSRGRYLRHIHYYLTRLVKKNFFTVQNDQLSN